MKTYLLSLVLIPSFLFSQDWTQRTDFPSSKRDDGVSFVLNNKGYCGTGLDDGFSPTRDFYTFDFTTEMWSNSQPLPLNKERQYATATSYDGNAYVFGGSNSTSSLNDLWRYNSTSNSWIELSALPDSGRAGCSNFILNNKWYIVGGKTESGLIKNEVWEYSFATDVWIRKNNLPNGGQWRGVAFSNTSIALVGLGLDSLNNYNNQFYQYDVALDSWTLNTSINISPRTYSVYAQIGDSIFIYGGLNPSGQLLNDFYRIGIQNQTVTNLTDFSSFERKGGMAFCSNDAFYMTTGVTLTARIKETWKATCILNLNENSLAQNVLVYQDHDLLKIESALEFDSFQLFNTTGRQVKTKSSSEPMIVNDISQGIYFYQLKTKGNVFFGKIFIQH